MELLSQLHQILAPAGLDLLRLCVWLAALLALFATLEKRWALHPQKLFRKAFGTDLVYYFLSGFTPKLLLLLPLGVVASAVHHVLPVDYYYWIEDLPILGRAAAALVVSEIGSYWGHRWSHEIPFLWRFHAIHHSAEEIDWLVNTRAHPIDMLFIRLTGLLPMYALGLAQPASSSIDLVPMAVTIIGTMWGFFIHANVGWRFRWLELLLSTPAFHHWHHTNDGPEQINKNYSAMLPWIDKCFGTFYLPQQWPRKYGIDAPPVADGLAGQMLGPLTWRKGIDAPAGDQPDESVLHPKM